MTTVVPAPFLTALLLGAGYLSFVAWDQSWWWRQKEDYSFGWLVPCFVAFVVYDRWPRITAALRACAAPGSPRAAGGAGRFLVAAVYVTLAGGVALFALGTLYRAGAGASQPGTLAISLGAAALLLTTFFLQAPVPEGPPTPAAGLSADARLRLAALFVFPALVWLVSAPMVSVVENDLSLFLLRLVSRIVSAVFDMLGLPIQQEGNVLVLPPVNGVENRVGVAEACSGIRSQTACLFSGSFLAAVFLEKFWKKALLVAMAMVLAFATNILRSLFLTGWAYYRGADAMEKQVHDIAGYVVIVPTVIGLLCLLPLLNLKVSFDRGGPDGPRPAGGAPAP